MQLTRYNSNGSLDSSFGVEGTVSLPGQGRSIGAIQADGKIVVATTNSSSDVLVLRVNLDGSLDADFGAGGQAVLGLPGSQPAFSIIVQPDGKIVVGGENDPGGSAGREVFVARFLSDGSLDTSFGGGDGVATGDLFPRPGEFDGLALQSDGKIVVAGYVFAMDNPDLALARFNADGSLDSTFGTGGTVVITAPQTEDLFNSVQVQPDGKIVAAGISGPGGPDQEYDMLVARFLADGSLDASFGSGGMVLTGVAFDDEELGMTLQPDGRIVAVGATDHGDPGSYDFLVAGYNTNGSLDGTFGSGGLVTADFGTQVDFAQAVAVQADGKLLVTGQSYGSTSGKLPLLRPRPSVTGRSARRSLPRVFAPARPEDFFRAA
jgi:uncharacterized delta-60 repeat protein